MILLIQEQVQDEDFSFKKEKNCANVRTKPIFASVLQQHCNLQDMYSTDHESHTPLQDDGDEPMMEWRRGCRLGDTSTETETDSCQR